MVKKSEVQKEYEKKHKQKIKKAHKEFHKVPKSAKLDYSSYNEANMKKMAERKAAHKHMKEHGG